MRLKEQQIKGTAEGLVHVTMNGQFKVVSLSIDERVLKRRDKETLENALVATYNDTFQRVAALGRDAIKQSISPESGTEK